MCKKFLIPFIFFGFILSFVRTSAYEIDTHAYLTKEAVDFFNANSPNQKITKKLNDYLLDGSRREDDIPRWMNHFYDPVHDVGLNDVLLGTWQTSKAWSQDSDNQEKLIYKIPTTIASVLTSAQKKEVSTLFLETNFVWKKALEYYVNGEKEKAMFTLGHILHLVEDASVPDHTRNDPHLGDSPYEKWTEKFTLENEDLDLKQRLENKNFVRLSNLNSYFSELATYSNNNFFSQDTIGIQSGYKFPIVENFPEIVNGRFYGVRIDEEKNKNLLFFYKNYNSNLLITMKTEVSLEDPQDLVVGSYWSSLSAKAVQYSAGVIDLFFKEAEKAKSDPNYFSKNPESFLAQLSDSVQGTISGVFQSIQNMIGNILGLFLNPVDISQDNLKNAEGALTAQLNQVTAPRVLKEELKDVIQTLNMLVPERSNLVSDENWRKEKQKELELFIAQLNKLQVKAKLLAEQEKSQVSGTSTVAASLVVYGGGGVIVTNENSSSEIPPIDNTSSTTTSTPPITDATSTPTSTASSSPIVPNFRVMYTSSSHELVFQWDPFLIENSSSTVSYEIKDLMSLDELLYRGEYIYEFRQSIQEIGREYEFSIQAFADNIEITSSTNAKIRVPSFMNELYFYRDTHDINGPNTVELRYSRYPFIPSPTYRVDVNYFTLMILYLNQNPQNIQNIYWADTFYPIDTTGMLSVGFKRCHGWGKVGPIIVLPEPGAFCVWGRYSDALNPSLLEDLRLVLPIEDGERIYSSSTDYITASFYSYEDSGPSSGFRFLSSDKTKYFFQDTMPLNQPPTMPTNIQTEFDSLHSSIYVTWDGSSDFDGFDEKIFYEFQTTTFSEWVENQWKDTKNFMTWDRKLIIPVEFPYFHRVGIRAVDEYGNRSEVSGLDWDFPEGYQPLPTQKDHSMHIGWAGDGERILIPRDVTVDAIAMWLGNGQPWISYITQNYLEIYEDQDGSRGALIASSTPITTNWPRWEDAWVTTEQKEYINTFETPLTLRANTYYWLVPQGGPDRSPAIRVFGSSNDSYADGAWSGNPNVDAYFRLHEVGQ